MDSLASVSAFGVSSVIKFLVLLCSGDTFSAVSPV